MEETMGALNVLGISNDEVVRIVCQTESEYRRLLSSITYNNLSDAEKNQFQFERQFWQVAKTVRNRLADMFGAEVNPPQYVGHGKAFLRRLAAQQRH